MPLALTLLAPPTQEPIRLEEQKLHNRVSLHEDDTLILGQISTFRDYAERFTGLQFLTAVYRLSVPCFEACCLRFPRPPLQSLVGTYVDVLGATQPLGITYVDSNGVTQTLATTVYGVDTDSLPGRVYLLPGQSWPSLYSVPNPVQATFKAGYVTIGAFFARHASLRSALLLGGGHLYEHREASQEAGVGKALSEIPLGVEALLWLNRLVEVF